MVTKGRYQTSVNAKYGPEGYKFYVIDTTTSTTMCVASTEALSDLVASALNFNYMPSNYGFRMVE